MIMIESENSSGRTGSLESNFAFLEPKWPILADLGKIAEETVYKDPNSAIVKMRSFSEKITEAVLKIEGLEEYLGARQIDRLDILERRGLLPESIQSLLHAIRRIGNKAAHDGNYGNADVGVKVIQLGFHLACWFMEVYVSFDFKKPPFRDVVDKDQLKDQEIEALKAQLKAQEEQYKQQLEALQAETDRQLKEERREVSTTYEKRHPLTEAETRILIDEQLSSVGFEADTIRLNYKNKQTMPEKNRKMAIAEWPCGTGYADYALFDGLVLMGIVEAKKYGKDISGDLQQAKTYAKEVTPLPGTELLSHGPWKDYKVPFIYATNGRPYLAQLAEKSGIWFWDARTPTNPSKPLEKWHSAQDLADKLKLNIDEANQQLEEDNDYPDFAARDYQIEAVKAVEQGLSEGKQRMLLAMATGTGKTRTALSLMYRLIKFKRVKRILFLVDRKSLGLQAEDALQDTKIEQMAFSDIYNVSGLDEILPEASTKIQIATVQGMVKRLFHADEAKEGNIPSIGTYDFIIVDEAHRGYKEDRELSDDELLYYDDKDYVSQYRRVIDYFDATVLGLTATPALHTTEIFGAPIYTYTYTDAVVDGYLVDHNPPIKFETELNKNGITFDKGEEIEIWNPDKNQIDKAHLEDELQFDIDSFNKKVVTESFNRVIMNELVDYIDPFSEEKTLIFAARDSHADMIVRLLKEAYANKDIPVDDDAIVKITSHLHDPNQLIKRFKNERYPNIAVTVDLLTTGVDVPKITNLVFMRRVKSRILYDQMLGRATRLCPEIEKEAFNIYDAVRLYDALEKVTDMKPLVKQPNIKAQDILMKALENNDDEAFEFYKTELIAKLQRKKQSLNEKDEEELCELNNVRSLDRWLHDLKTATPDVLRNEEENILRLAEYKRETQPFIISEKEDQLLSVTRGYGSDNQAKPGDYLEEFDQYIRTHVNEVPALQVVVNRPKDLTRQDLKEIQLELKRHQFDEKDLQKAWSQAKNEEIAADIISFIRQAALGTKLIDHDERIKHAMKKVYELNPDWTPSQRKWLERIESQLLKQSILGPDAKSAFDDGGIFQRNGGYKRMKQYFGDYTEVMIDTLNTYLYA